MTLPRLSFTPHNHRRWAAHHSQQARCPSAQRLQTAREALSDRLTPSPGLDSHPKPNPNHRLPCRPATRIFHSCRDAA